MNECEDSIKTLIENEGSVGVDRFISEAVRYYYNAKDPFGERGDFVTAPEVSQMFGELIGVWIFDIWEQLGYPEAIQLIEVGPGRGTLISDIQRVLFNVGKLRQALSIVLVENSKTLIEKQKSVVQHANVNWCETLDDPIILESDIPLILIANEFLDALPIKQFEKIEHDWKERVIVLKDKTFDFGLKDIDNTSKFEFPKAETGEIFEYSDERIRFIKDIISLLKSRKGAALFIDYGHMQSNTGDTLQAVKNHQFTSVLSELGEADLTSHVDFEVLKNIALKSEVMAHGPTTQAEFLHQLGIGVRLNTLMQNASEDKKKELEFAYNRLCSNKEMGELFKVMALSFDQNINPSGFK
jgi:SAM-dependent MidA family methyltransferase